MARQYQKTFLFIAGLVLSVLVYTTLNMILPG
jgi:hypothetical protein